MALPDENELTHELFDAHAHAKAWNHIFKFMIPMSLKCAVELSIPDIIKNHGKPMTLSELINALQINKDKSHCVHRLMRLLVNSEFFIKVDIKDENKQEEGYWLTPSSNLLLKDSPLPCVTPYLLFILDPILMKAFSSMSEWLAGDHCPTAFETAHGSTLWEKGKTDTRLNKLMFNEGMERHARFESYIILKGCEKLFEGVESMVDVGGGTGNIAKAVADAFPETKCTVLDLPHVVAGLEGAGNLNYVGGNMFEAIPTADVVLIKV